MDELRRKKITEELGKVQHREIEIRADTIDEDARTVSLAISSEDPYQRWSGVEILGHEAAEVRLERLNNRAPLLLGHDMDKQIGVIEPGSARIDDDKVLRATARFSRSALGEEIFKDVLDGIRSKVSVGYRIFSYEWKMDESGQETDQYRVTDWEPMEASSVSVPADDTVGFGRGIDSPDPDKAAGEDPPQKTNAGPQPPEKERSPNMGDKNQGGDQVSPLEVKVEVTGAIEEERARVSEIQAIGKRFPDSGLDIDKAIRDGWEPDRVRVEILDAMEAKASKAAPPDAVGLSDNEIKRFSLLRCIQSQIGINVDVSFEREVSRQLEKQLNQEARGFLIPHEVKHRGRVSHTRVLEAGVATAAAELVGTDHLGGEFIDVLRNSMMVRMMGARILSGLRGDVSIPKKTAGASAAWIAAEDDDAANSEMATDEVTLTPHDCAAYTDMSRRLVQQSDPSVEQLVSDDLAIAAALAIDLAAINGSGASGQPTGILNTVGIGNVPGGVNGADPSWANTTALWGAVAQDNALMGAMGWLTNAKVVAKMMSVDRATDTANFIINELTANPMLLGYRLGISNQVPSDLDKGTSVGVCSANIFANWMDLIIGEWGGLDLMVDPFARSLKGGLRIIVFQTVDVALRHEESFAATQDLLTV